VEEVLPIEAGADIRVRGGLGDEPIGDSETRGLAVKQNFALTSAALRRNFGSGYSISSADPDNALSLSATYR
jgi:hypothetical protein